jgi:membrane protein required for colicin V production
MMLIVLLILVIVLISVIIGIVRGFVKELSAIVGLILGIYIAALRYPMLEKYIIKIITNPSITKVVSFIIIFLVVFFLIIVLGLLLQKAIHLIMLGWLDKLLGGMFGIIKGLIISWLLLMLATAVYPNSVYSIQKSTLAPRLFELGAKITRIPIKIPRSKKLLTQSGNLNILNVSYKASIK